MATKTRLSVKGLDKIFGEGISEVISDIQGHNFNKDAASMIKLSEIRPNPHQPRKIFSSEDLNELANSIKQHGVIQPIVVKKSINGYNLIAGERRTRAARVAGLTEIPAIVLDIDDKTMKEIALVENIQRVDLSPIEEAVAYRELGELLDLTQENLAQRLGKSRSHIANTMRLLLLPTAIQELVLNKTLTMGQVRPLITLDNEQQMLSLAQQIVDKQLNARQVEELVKRLTNNTTSTSTSTNSIDNTHRAVSAALEEKLMHQLGTKVSIETNRLVIDYAGIKDLNRILGILGLLENNL